MDNANIWIDIPHYFGLYQINNSGEIWDVKNQKYVNHWYKDLDKYEMVKLYDTNNKAKLEYVHRLVAISFIPNKNKYPCVHHLDENKHNNCASNLEWISRENHLKLHRPQLKGSLGYKWNDIQKKNASISAKKKPPMSDETKKKISDYRKGKHHTEETKRKISISEKNTKGG